MAGEDDSKFRDSGLSASSRVWGTVEGQEVTSPMPRFVCGGGWRQPCCLISTGLINSRTQKAGAHTRKNDLGSVSPAPIVRKEVPSTNRSFAVSPPFSEYNCLGFGLYAWRPT
ncbi:unnamed protein product [Laminaria digitata]